MTTRITAAVLILVLTAVAQTTPPTDKTSSPVADKSAAPTKLEQGLFKAFGNYGGWWNNISDAEKDAFIDGFTTAMARANALTVALCKSTMNEAKPGAANFNEKFNGGMELCFVGNEFAFNPEQPLKPKLNEFYKDPLNFRIPVQNAMDYVRDEMSGRKTAGQLLDELNDWRKVLNGGKN
jgi:hypothetical protein